MTDPKRAGRSGAIALLAAGLILPLAAIAPAAQAEEQAPLASGSTLTAATFAEPPMSSKPMYRWWMPLAYTDDAVLEAQLEDLAASGAGGVEVAPFVVAGAQNQTDAFLTDYGWGTPAWAHKMEVITGKAAELGLQVDQNLGPHYPSTVPTLNNFNQPEAEQQLLFGWELVTPGASRSGAMPALTTAPPQVKTKLTTAAAVGQTTLTVSSLSGLGVGDTITVGAGTTAERVEITSVGGRLESPLSIAITPLVQAHASGEEVTNVAETTRVRAVIAQCAAGCTESGAPVSLIPESVQDVTASVTDGTFDFTAPEGEAPWVVIDFQQAASGVVAQSNGYTPTQPNYVPDHLSAAGAQIQADFWDASILTETVRANLDKIGAGSIFEDSLEHGESQKWTWDLPQRFADERGYDIATVLPALAGIGIQGAHAPAFELAGVGPQAREDYRETVSDLYIDGYVRTLQTWAEGHGLNYRAQSYGLPISTSEAAAVTGIPEGESLNFGSPNPLGAEEDYRVVSSGAHLTGKNLVSVECCAVFLGGYRSSMAGANIGGQFSDPSPADSLGGARSQGLLDSVYKSYAGGVNQLVWHGYAYPDAPTGTGIAGRDGGTWPGYQPWDFYGQLNVNDVFGPRQANWEDNAKVNEALARTQLVLREGRAQLDLGVYYEDLGLAGSSVSQQQPEQHFFGTDSAVAQAGYTYEYAAPEFFSDPSLTPGADGGLFEERSGYHAVILNDQRTMSLEGAQHITRLAQAGLRVFIVGRPPETTTGKSIDDAMFTSTIETLLAQPTVVRVDNADALPAALTSAGITPASAAAEPTSALGFVNRAAEGVQYTFVYNRSGAPVAQDLTLAGTGTPMRLNQWTGEIEPLGRYTENDGSLTVPVEVGSHDAVIIAVAQTPLIAAPRTHAVSSTAAVVANGAGLNIRAVQDGTYETTLADGSVVESEVSGIMTAPNLTDWSLSAQTWGPADDATGMTASHTRKVDQPEIALTAAEDGTLPAWLEIAGEVDLSRASGLGTYRTSFTLPDTWTENDGLLLNLGDVLDTASVTVNGTALSVNQADRSSIDIGAALQAGENTLEVRVATTMFNAVRSTGDSNYQGQAWQRTGLMGPVTLTAYRDIAVVAAEEPGGADTEADSNVTAESSADSNGDPDTGADGATASTDADATASDESGSAADGAASSAGSEAGTTGAAADGTDGARDPLAVTGAQLGLIGIAAASLIAAGVLMLVRKRRRSLP